MPDLNEKLKNLSLEEKEDLMKKIQKKAMQDCLFCKIVRGEIPSRKIFENENILAFLDIHPVNPGHVLVIPKKHSLFLTQLKDSELSELIKVVRDIASIVFEITNAEGITITQNNGKAAGQVIPHIHFHIIPRFENDGFQNKWSTKKLTDSQFDEIQRKIISITSKFAAEKPTVSKDLGNTKKDVPTLSPRIP